MFVEFCTEIGRRARPLLFLIVAGCFGKDPGPEFTGGCSDAACSDVPVMVTGGKTFTKLAAGRFHTCGLVANGEVWCWGLNSGGQLGASTPSAVPADPDVSAVPVKVSGTKTFKDITAGALHTCGIGTDDGLWCWGSNEYLALGVANAPDTCEGGTCSLTPVRAAGTETFKSVSAGSVHTCAVNLSGTAKCWGVNGYGELGSSSYGQVRSDPNVVSGDHIFTRVSAGERFSCALDDLGAMSCWGLANDGQLATSTVSTCTAGGLNPFLCSPSPVAANTPVRFSSVDLGTKFGCGLSTQGGLACWGLNTDGQLGTGTFTGSVAPVSVQATGTWQAFAVGESHACGIKSGVALCWGLNNTAQLGTGTKVYASNAPQPVLGTRTYTQIAAGFHHTCAIATDGTTWCWGSDAVKQLGRG